MKDKKISVGVTGVTGFVGKRLMTFNATKFDLVPISLRGVELSEISLEGIDAIVHLAGKAHQMEPIDDAVYYTVNTELTRQLAQAAKEQGVKQFIYISSTKVYGDEISRVLTENSACVPTDAYGKSKRAAEQLLAGMQSSEFQVGIVRPPLVYGPAVKGNMIRLLKLAGKGYPLPFGRTGNARSMVFVDNLIALINTIIEQNASGIYLAGDSKPLSTDELLRLIRQEMGMPSRLVSIPRAVRKIIRRFRPALFTRLFGSFELNTSSTNQRLNFIPPYTTQEGIREMVKWYQQLP